MAQQPQPIDTHPSFVSLVFDAGSHISNIMTVFSSAAWFANIVGAPVSTRFAFVWWQENVTAVISTVMSAPSEFVLRTQQVPPVLYDFFGVGLTLGVSFILGLAAARSRYQLSLASTYRGFARRWGTWILLFVTTVVLWPMAMLVFLVLAIFPGSMFARPEDAIVGRVWMWLSLLPIMGMSLVLLANYVEHYD